MVDNLVIALIVASAIILCAAWYCIQEKYVFTPPANVNSSNTTSYLTIDPSSNISVGTFYNVPVGFIGMWAGTPDTIPAGWALCDGTNNTPDLRSRFVVGATTSGEVGPAGLSTYTAYATGGKEYILPYPFVDIPNASTTNSSYFEATVEKNVTQYGIPSLPPYYALAFIMKTM
uniref:Tail collar domain protein n=1 Tax=viral metagenome TaxID=1070528 RepID=A0A6C0KU50_9ZZZZ